MLAGLKIGKSSAKLGSVTFRPFLPMQLHDMYDPVGLRKQCSHFEDSLPLESGFYRVGFFGLAFQRNFHHSSVLQHSLMYLRRYFLL